MTSTEGTVSTTDSDFHASEEGNDTERSGGGGGSLADVNTEDELTSKNYKNSTSNKNSTLTQIATENTITTRSRQYKRSGSKKVSFLRY